MTGKKDALPGCQVSIQFCFEFFNLLLDAFYLGLSAQGADLFQSVEKFSERLLEIEPALGR